jgi:hypothetical protein
VWSTTVLKGNIVIPASRLRQNGILNPAFVTAGVRGFTHWIALEWRLSGEVRTRCSIESCADLIENVESRSGANLGSQPSPQWCPTVPIAATVNSHF